MKFIVLGSGTSVPHPKRSSPGFWLETENGSLLLDCSASAIHRMAQENLNWINLDAIWISHFHLDHVGGLAPFLFGTRHAPGAKERKKPLKICGARGLKKLIESFNEAGGYKLLEQPFPVEIIEVEPLEKFYIFDELEAVAAETRHTNESLAIHLRYKNDKTLVYTADTGFAKSLGALAQAVDLLVLECSFFRDKPKDTHLELSEAIYLTRFAKPKRTVLTHFYPDWDAVDFEKEVKKLSSQWEIIQAKDGLRLEII